MLMMMLMVCATCSTLSFSLPCTLPSVVTSPPQRLADPVDEVEHVAPARGGELFAVLAVVQVLLVADVLQPVEQQRPRIVAAGVWRARCSSSFT